MTGPGSRLPDLALVEARLAAVELTRRGWPVHPGTYLAEDGRTWCGRLGSCGLEPVADCRGTPYGVDPAEAFKLWSAAPYSVLADCGGVFDALQVGAAHGRRALGPLREARALGPVVDGPAGTWLLLVRPGVLLRPDLAARGEIRLFGAGYWIPLPPTVAGRVPYRWRITPSAVAWQLPNPRRVQEVLVATALPPMISRG